VLKPRPNVDVALKLSDADGLLLAGGARGSCRPAFVSFARSRRGGLTSTNELKSQLRCAGV